MKISVNWLNNYITLPPNTDFQALGDLFTIRTAEVEEVINLGESYNNIVVGQIKEILPHPNADKLKITQTNVGKETLKIVCGATNIFVGQKVAVALIGAKVRWHGEGDLVELKPTKIRGEDSFGMICGASEIGLKDEVDGIMDLSHLEHEPGTPIAQALNKNDVIIDIENKTLTHRPDLWGHYGIAREFAAITDQKLRPIEFFKDWPQKLTTPIVPVTVQEPELCPRYLSTTLNNIKVGPSPEWLKNALENTGNRSINNIVDATNFVMLELGNPLHAFDTDKIDQEIIVRRAKKGEKIETLDQEAIELDTETLIIADLKKPLAIAGIKGGLHSGINENTTSITLEAANFNPISTRKTSVRLGIRTEAVQRYEKDLDPLLVEQALERLVKIILDLCPQAEIVSPKIDINNFKYKIRKIKLDLARTCSKIGAEISAAQIQKDLEKLEFKVKPFAHHLEVEVPSFRATKDINHSDDLIEEIARLYGYEKLPANLPELKLQPGTPNTERLEKYDLRNILSLELGFNECINYSFYSKKTLEESGLIESEHLKIRNYLSEEQTHLRTTLIPSLLKNAAENLKNFDHCRLYEIGHTYKYINQYFPLEEKYLAGLIVLGKKDNSEVFYQVKTVIQTILERLGISSLQFRQAESASSFAHPNKHAAWFDFKTEQEIIQIYELHPAISQNFDLSKNKIGCFTINYSLLHQLARNEKTYKPIFRFPAIAIDISALFDANQTIAEVEKAIKKADQNLIRSVQLFDFYQGANITPDKKSLAFKIILQAPDRTLTDEEMKQIQQKIFQNLQKIGAEIRGL